ncbi:hypothetical protein DHEL01_v207346 [Diaporthe helianthi]|uniref:Uncharacterized protein n=1 Tax=Diaporthe helianthi TaxID=158607 RepID=A0A2P5HVG4_DIAHE|nr:hypothetical protein DHEL01_v207346 [Diaporthe helianthi]
MLTKYPARAPVPGVALPGVQTNRPASGGTRHESLLPGHPFLLIIEKESKAEQTALTFRNSFEMPAGCCSEVRQSRRFQCGSFNGVDPAGQAVGHVSACVWKLLAEVERGEKVMML